MEAPPTTPTQTWKTAVHTLDSLLCSRHIATLPDISHALSWSWAPSTLYTYRGRIARIADRASSSNPTLPDRELVETFLLELLATGSSASTIRTTLSALQCLHSLNILAWSIPPVWWRLSTSADRLALRAPQARNWFPLAAFSELGLSFTSSSDMAFLAMLLISIALGLRIGEAAAIRPCDVVLPTGNMPGYIRILPEKCNPRGSGPTTRCPPAFIFVWATTLTRAFPGHRADLPFFPTSTIRSEIARTFHNTSARGMSFHSLRRACARYMWLQGHDIQTICNWCRWKTEDMARHYIGDTSADTFPIFSLPWPHTSVGEHSAILPAIPDLLWNPPINQPANPKPQAGKHLQKRSRHA